MISQKLSPVAVRLYQVAIWTAAEDINTASVTYVAISIMSVSGMTSWQYVNHLRETL